MDIAVKKNAKFVIESKGFCAKCAMTLMALSVIFRLIGCWEGMGEKVFALTQIVLPVACCLLFIVAILMFGKRCFFLSSLPFLLGIVFFIIKSFTFDSLLHTVLCIMLYLVAAILYTATVFGVIHTKWLLVPLFALPFIYHVAIEDVAILKAGEFTLFTGLQEISVLCIMLALLFTALGLKKVKPFEESDLPKIKDPVVKPPEMIKPNVPEGKKDDNNKPQLNVNSEDKPLPEEKTETAETEKTKKEEIETEDMR